MSHAQPAEKSEAVKTYLLDHFPESYAGFRRDYKSRDLRFLLEFKATARIIVFTPEFLDGHTAETIPACLERNRLNAQIQNSRTLYIIVGRERIEGADDFPKRS